MDKSRRWIERSIAELLWGVPAVAEEEVDTTRILRRM